MLIRHPTATGIVIENAVTEDRSPQTTTYSFPESRWTCGPAQKPKAEQVQGSNPATTNANRLKWEAVALWLFIASIFIVSVLAGYLLWLKCS
jgi:hypothetical protein